MSDFLPYRLGAHAVVAAALAVLASAFVPEWIPEIAMGGAALIVAFVLVRYLALPRLFRRQHALQIVDARRKHLLLGGCAAALAAFAVAYLRRTQGPPVPLPPRALLALAAPLAALAAPVILLAMVHRRLVLKMWFGLALRQSAVERLAWRLVPLVGPGLALLFLPAVWKASQVSERWQAQLFVADLVGRSPDDGPPEPPPPELAPALVDWLWWSEARTPDEEKALRRQAAVLLRIKSVAAAAAARLGTRPAVGLAATPPSPDRGDRQQEVTGLFHTITEGARRPFVRAWLRGRCESAREEGASWQADLAQEELWQLANVCRPEDAAGWWRTRVRSWLQPDKTWSFRGSTWLVHAVPTAEKGGRIKIGGDGLFRQSAGQDGDFAGRILGAERSQPCQAGQPWRVFHLWRPPVSDGSLARWEGAIAVAPRSDVCFVTAKPGFVGFGEACAREREDTRFSVPLVWIARPQAGARPQGAAAPPPLTAKDRELLLAVMGAPGGGGCQAPSHEIEAEPAFTLETPAGETGGHDGR